MPSRDLCSSCGGWRPRSAAAALHRRRVLRAVTFLTVHVSQIIQAYLRRLLADYVRKIILMRVGVAVTVLHCNPAPALHIRFSPASTHRARRYILKRRTAPSVCTSRIQKCRQKRTRQKMMTSALKWEQPTAMPTALAPPPRSLRWRVSPSTSLQSRRRVQRPWLKGSSPH